MTMTEDEASQVRRSVAFTLQPRLDCRVKIQARSKIDIKMNQSIFETKTISTSYTSSDPDSGSNSYLSSKSIQGSSCFPCANWTTNLDLEVLPILTEFKFKLQLQFRVKIYTDNRRLPQHAKTKQIQIKSSFNIRFRFRWVFNFAFYVQQQMSDSKF